MLRLVPTPKTPFSIRPVRPVPARAPVIPIATAAPFERTPEGIITAAVDGNPVARELLRPIVRDLAKAATVYVEERARVEKAVLGAIRFRSGIGRPRPGNAARWLENVTRAFAKDDFEATYLEAEEEPFHEKDGEGDDG